MLRAGERVQVEPPVVEPDPYSGVDEPTDPGDAESYPPPIFEGVVIAPAGMAMPVGAARPVRRETLLFALFPYGTVIEQESRVHVETGMYAGSYVIADGPGSGGDAGHWRGMSGWQAGSVYYLRRVDG